jgi:ankyrin repeat protein
MTDQLKIPKDNDPSHFDVKEFTEFYGATHPAHVAVLNNDLDALRRLHDAGGVGALTTHFEQANQFTPLSFAILLFRHAAVTLLLSFGVPVDEHLAITFMSARGVSWADASALQLAAMRSDVAILEALLAATSAVIARAHSLCLWAAHNSDPAVLNMLIQRGFDVRMHGFSGVPPIVAASTNPNPTFVNMLLAAGSDVTACDSQRISPLHAAIRSKSNESIVTALLAAGASVSARAGDERTPVHFAAMHANSTTMAELLKHCTVNDVNLVDSNNRTACDLARSRDVLAALLAHGGEFGGEFVDEFGDEFGGDFGGMFGAFQAASALEMAVDNANELAVQHLLLKPRVDLSVRSREPGREGRTLLHRAACVNSAEIVQMLLDAGVDKEERCKRMRTAVHYAASSDGCDALRVLVAAGADLYATDQDSLTALHFACACDNMASLNVFATAGIDLVEAAKSDVSLVCSAARAMDAQVLHHLMRHGVDFRSRNRSGQTPCVGASPRGLERLFAAGVDLTHTPNVGTAEYLDERPILTLLAAGADVGAYWSATSRTVLSDSMALLCAGNIVDESAVTLLPNAVTKAIKKIAQRQFELMRLRAFEVVVGLQPLGLSALVTCEILAFAFAPQESLIPFHRVWAIATLAKHFHASKVNSE